MKIRPQRWRGRPVLWYNFSASTNAMADRVPHPSSIRAATFGPYAYGFSYRTWRFS